MEYSDLQAKILQYLYIHPEGVTGTKLASHCGVSLNTIRREFVKIYDMPGEESFEVVSRPSIGYQMLVEDSEKAILFFQQLNNKMNNPLFDNNDPKTYKANAIIRRLLTDQYYINLITLTEMFNYSESSLRRDLKEVERQLQNYQLVLKHKKGSGYYIEGDELNKRLCLLGQHRLYVNLSDEEKKLEPRFQMTFDMDNLQMKECTKKVRKMLAGYENLSYKLIDVPNVIHYIPLIKTRRRYTGDVSIDDAKRIRLERSGLIEVAREILQSVSDRIDYDEQEVMAFAAVLQGYRTVGRISQILEEERRLLEADVEGILHTVDQVLLVSDVMTEADRDELLCNYYDVQNRMIFAIYQDSETYRKLRHRNIFTEDLCYAVKKWMEERTGHVLQEDLELSFYYVFERLVERKTFQRDHLRLVLVSTYGVSYGSYCKKILQEIYAPYIEQLEVLEYSRMESLKEKEFDYLVTDIRVEMLQPELKEKICFLETQDTVRKRCKALQDIIYGRQQAAMEQFVSMKTIHGADHAKLRGHSTQKYQNLPLFTCCDDVREPGIYIYEPEEPLVFQQKKMKKVAVVFYHPTSYDRLRTMEEELTKKR